jgi:hypothetical protein
LVLADGKLLIMKTDGQLLLVDPKPEQFRGLASAQLFDGTTQALVALSDGLLFARDTRLLKCVEVGKRAESTNNTRDPAPTKRPATGQTH